MIEIRFHGRGGQGVVTSAYLLGLAAFKEGKYCQAFPFFGTERRGAPVTSFARIDKKFIKTREQIYNPDYVVVLDSTLLDVVNVVEGIKENGMVIVNSNKTIDLSTKAAARFVDAMDIALRIIGKPFVNTPMIGALVGASGIVKFDSVVDVIKERFPAEIAEKNVEAAREAYERMRG